MDITSHPQDQLNVTPGQNVTFSVDAVFGADTDQRHFDWYKNGDVITDSPGVHSGTSTDTLTVISADESDVGVYYVQVSGVRISPFSVDSFSVESDHANLTLRKFDL